VKNNSPLGKIAFILFSFLPNGVNDDLNGTGYPSATLGTGKRRGTYITASRRSGRHPNYGKNSVAEYRSYVVDRPFGFPAHRKFRSQESTL